MKVNHPHFTDVETVEILRNLLNVTQLVSHRIHILTKHLPSASSFKKSGARTLSSSQRSTNNLLCYLRKSHHLSGPQFLYLAKTFYEPIHTFMPFSSPTLQFLDVARERNAICLKGNPSLLLVLSLLSLQERIALSQQLHSYKQRQLPWGS